MKCNVCPDGSMMGMNGCDKGNNGEHNGGNVARQMERFLKSSGFRLAKRPLKTLVIGAKAWICLTCLGLLIGARGNIICYYLITAIDYDV